jgi:hypothetical protein
LNDTGCQKVSLLSKTRFLNILLDEFRVLSSDSTLLHIQAAVNCSALVDTGPDLTDIHLDTIAWH